MKIEYRGFELEVKKERSLGGDYPLYITAYRLKDDYEYISSYEYSEEKVKDRMDSLKNNINDYYEMINEGYCPECCVTMIKDKPNVYYCAVCEEYYYKEMEKNEDVRIL